MTGKLNGLSLNRDGTQNITITLDSDFREEYDKLKDSNISIEIKKVSNRRSMDANNYFWHLCGEIAKHSSKFSTDGKNEIYKEAIRAKGEFEPLYVREDGVDFFVSRWGEKGTGWFAEVMDDCIAPEDRYNDMMGGYVESFKLVHAYYGSSTYNTIAMSRIIDYVVLIANDLGIPTMTPKEEKRMLDLWGKRYRKKHGDLIG